MRQALADLLFLMSSVYEHFPGHPYFVMQELELCEENLREWIDDLRGQVKSLYVEFNRLHRRNGPIEPTVWGRDLRKDGQRAFISLHYV